MKSRALVTAEARAWGLGDTHLDPGEVLIRLVSQSSRRAERYAAEIERLVAESPHLRDALVGDAYGEFGKTGEYIRGMAVLEAQERDRCANFATKAIAAGLNERMVRLAEAQGQLLAGVISKILDQLELTDEQRANVPAIVRKELTAVSSAA